MKKTITALASLAIAATAAAHTTAVPHTHSGFEMNWQTFFIGATVAAVVLIAFFAIRKKLSGTK